MSLSSKARVCLLYCSALLIFTSCHVKDQLKKSKDAVERNEAKRKIAEKSDKIWQETAQDKIQKMGNSTVPTPVTLTMDGKAVSFPDMVLVLGKLKVEGDLQGGQEFSSIISVPTKAPSFSIKNIPIESAVKTSQIAGQNLTIDSENSKNTEIILENNQKYRLVDGLIQFVREDGNTLVVSLEGNAQKIEPEEQGTPVTISGDFNIRVELPKPPSFSPSSEQNP